MGVYTQNCLKIDFCVCIFTSIPVCEGGDRHPGAVPISISEHSVGGGGGNTSNGKHCGKETGTIRQIFRNVGMPKH